MFSANRVIQVSALALGIAGVLAIAPAQASGFQLKENSVKGMGAAFSRSAIDETDASVVVNNPATMARFEGTTVQGDLSVIDLNAEFDGSGTDLLGQPLTGGNGGEAGDVTPVPALSVVHNFDNGLAVGAMVSAPFGLKTEYDEAWVGRYYAQKSEVEIVELALTASVDIVPDRLSVGGGLTFSNADVTLSKAVDFGTALFGAGVPLPFARPQAADGFAEVQGDDTGIGWIAGVDFRPTDKLSIGLSYRSEVDYDLEGTADWTVPGNVRTVLDSTPRAPLFRDGDVTAKLTTPSTTTLSVGYAFNDQFSLAATYSETGWESLQEVRINFANPDPDSVEDFSWEDTAFMSLGGEFKLNDAWTLRAGYAYDETPTSVDTRTPRLPDEDRQWFSVGATWGISEQLDLSFAYTHIKPDTPEIAIITPPAAGGQRRSGDYDSSVNLFGLSAQYRF
ncbi:MAG TPA: porin [Luteimonas sp.]|nr:porin [Luteimonas sp.]